MLHDCDILLLQELMLEKRDLEILSDLHENFKYIAEVRDREMEGICEGRPSRGVAIYWRDTFSSSISPVYANDSLIGIILNSGSSKLLILNVYLPCDTQDRFAVNEYKQSLANLENVIRDQNVNEVLIMGDFNADPNKGRFWDILNDFTNSLSFLNMHFKFPDHTFSYLCPNKDSTSWLDHIVCSKIVADKIKDVSVDYGSALFDHFPVKCILDWNIGSSHSVDFNYVINEFVNWKKISAADRANICKYVNAMLIENGMMDHRVFCCKDVHCQNKDHKAQLVDLYSKARYILLSSTKDFIVNTNRNFKIIPGWNDYVKQHFTIARQKFLTWVSQGKPSSGRVKEEMRLARSNFKLALNECKENEHEIRNVKLLDSLKNKSHKDFWSEIHRLTNHNVQLPISIDGKYRSGDICNSFSERYKRIFCKPNARFVNVNISERKKTEILLKFSCMDIRDCRDKLKDNIGCDMIHTNHLKMGSDLLLEFIASLFSSFIIHNFIPLAMLKGVITPIVKDKFGNMNSSDNYRPVMSSSVFLKLFEYCLLTKMDPYIKLNDRQHGFRKKYSTATACFVLKETVLNYTNAGSNVYSCFLDISKAFDSVNHNILLNKLC